MVANSTFVRNQAIGGANGGQSLGSGGAVVAASATGSVTGCTFTDNEALGGPVSNGVTAYSQGLGGAVNNYGWSSGFTFTVSNSTFTGNKAVGGAGSTSVPSDPTSFGGFGGGILAYLWRVDHREQFDVQSQPGHRRCGRRSGRAAARSAAA